jgi:hypothetical protein
MERIGKKPEYLQGDAESPKKPFEARRLADIKLEKMEEATENRREKIRNALAASAQYYEDRTRFESNNPLAIKKINFLQGLLKRVESADNDQLTEIVELWKQFDDSKGETIPDKKYKAKTAAAD